MTPFDHMTCAIGSLLNDPIDDPFGEFPRGVCIYCGVHDGTIRFFYHTGNMRHVLPSNFDGMMLELIE